MDSRLIVYNYKNIAQLKEHFSGYSIGSYTSVIEGIESSEELIEKDLEDSILDITNYIFDTKNQRYYRSYFESCFRIIIKNFENVKFIISDKISESFFELYPYLLDRKEIEYFKEDCEVIPEEDIVKTRTNKERYSEVYIYENNSVLEDNIDSKLIFSMTEFVESFDGISIRFNFDFDFDNIYMDLTSLMRHLNLRQDQVFSFELILNKLIKEKCNKFLIKEEFEGEMEEFFPYHFDCKNKIKKSITEEHEKHNYLADLDTAMELFNKKLYGHAKFKEDLEVALKKFKYLNSIGRKNIFSIFVCGESGTGKTELARQLQYVFFENEKFIKINFGNYSTKDVLNSLIGSPKGYIGSQDGGELTNKIKESKSRIILIDEFEKADSQVFNFFYELLEDGKYTDRLGEEHCLNQYIVILTSNLDGKNYNRYIPKALGSRFDMKYIFEELTWQEKSEFIEEYKRTLFVELKKFLPQDLQCDTIEIDYNELRRMKNMRDIKSKIESEIISKIIDK